MPTMTSRIAWSLAVGAVAVAGVATAAVPGPSAVDRAADVVTERAVRVEPPTPAVVIGDSAIAALRWVPGASDAVIGFEHTLDLESCRRLLAPSCNGREGRAPPTVYESLFFHRDSYHTLVVATGYNDSTAGFTTAFRSIVSLARAFGYERIVWWTLRSDVDYVSPGDVGNHRTFAATNEVLESLVDSGDYPEVVLADWAAYSDGKVEWFVTDGVHYRAVGAWAAADYLSRKMAFLDGRACPLPENPGGVPRDPCPDPDDTGPITDVEALYPVGEDGVLCYEIGTDRRIECRYDSHVIRITRELEVGDTGPDVRALQTRLLRLGFFDHVVTGLFDSTTGEAVRVFQVASADLEVSGRADVATLDALGFDVSAVEGDP